MRKIIFILLVSIAFLCSCNQNTKLWRIQEDGLYGFVDSVGNVVIEPQYKYVGNFRAGYACIITDARLEIEENILKKDTMLWVKYGYIDKAGQLLELETPSTKIDTTAPTLSATTNSIVATFKQSDSKSGINNSTIQYAIKNDSQGHSLCAYNYFSIDLIMSALRHNSQAVGKAW